MKVLPGRRPNTASVAGDWPTTRDLCTAAGVLVADTLDEFDGLVLIALGLAQREAPGLGLGGMSNAGFEAVTLADRAAPLQLAALGAATVERLAALLEGRRLHEVVSVRNPLDVTPILDDAGFAEAAATILDDVGHRVRGSGIPTFRRADQAADLLGRWVQWRTEGRPR